MIDSILQRWPDSSKEIEDGLDRSDRHEGSGRLLPSPGCLHMAFDFAMAKGLVGIPTVYVSCRRLAVGTRVASCVEISDARFARRLRPWLRRWLPIHGSSQRGSRFCCEWIGVEGREGLDGLSNAQAPLKPLKAFAVAAAQRSAFSLQHTPWGTCNCCRTVF